MNLYYLDHNIYISSLYDNSIPDAIKYLKQNNIYFAYSPAHIEEIYKAQCDMGDKYTETRKLLLKTIDFLTDSFELLPSNKGVITKFENTQACYNRVAVYDTREIIAIQSTQRFNIDNNFYKYLIKKDKHNVSISSLSPEEVWLHPLITTAIINLNKSMPSLIEEYNNSTDILYLLKICNIDKRLSCDLRFMSESFLQLQDSHTQLEFIIEILFRILSFYGYNSDKSEKTSLSGTHDVSHAICATKVNKFFTTDKRFAKRIEAVYYFLKVPTQVIFCSTKDISVQLLKYS